MAGGEIGEGGEESDGSGGEDGGWAADGVVCCLRVGVWEKVRLPHS
jgi:hypothetical protein